MSAPGPDLPAQPAPRVPCRQAWPARISVQIGDTLGAALEAEAQAMGMKPSKWINSLLRHRIFGCAVLRREDELAFIAVQSELRRIGVQASHVLGSLETPGPDSQRQAQIAQLVALRLETRDLLYRLRGAFEGNLAYWETKP